MNTISQILLPCTSKRRIKEILIRANHSGSYLVILAAVLRQMCVHLSYKNEADPNQLGQFDQHALESLSDLDGLYDPMLAPLAAEILGSQP